MMCIMHVDERRGEIIFIDFAKNVEQKKEKKIMFENREMRLSSYMCMDMKLSK